MLNFASGIAKAAHQRWSCADWMELITLSCSIRTCKSVAWRRAGFFGKLICTRLHGAFIFYPYEFRPPSSIRKTRKENLYQISCKISSRFLQSFPFLNLEETGHMGSMKCAENPISSFSLTVYPVTTSSSLIIKNLRIVKVLINLIKSLSPTANLALSPCSLLNHVLLCRMKAFQFSS